MFNIVQIGRNFSTNGQKFFQLNIKHICSMWCKDQCSVCDVSPFSVFVICYLNCGLSLDSTVILTDTALYTACRKRSNVQYTVYSLRSTVNPSWPGGVGGRSAPP